MKVTEPLLTYIEVFFQKNLPLTGGQSYQKALLVGTAAIINKTQESMAMASVKRGKKKPKKRTHKVNLVFDEVKRR